MNISYCGRPTEPISESSLSLTTKFFKNVHKVSLETETKPPCWGLRKEGKGIGGGVPSPLHGESAAKSSLWCAYEK